MINALILTLKGMVLGVTIVVPGISGGTIAVLLGIYETLTESIGNFLTAPFKKKIEYTKFLFFLGIGATISILIFANLVKYAIANHPKITVGVLTLIIIPTIPLITKGEDRTKNKNRMFFILGILITGAFIIIDYKSGARDGIATGVIFTTGYYLKLIMCGAIAAGAMIIPGISGSLLLLMLGEYYNVLDYVSSFKNLINNLRNVSQSGLSLANLFADVSILPLIFFSIGIVFGLIIIARMINYLLKRWRGETLFFITGLVVVSIIQIWLAI